MIPTNEELIKTLKELRTEEKYKCYCNELIDRLTCDWCIARAEIENNLQGRLDIYQLAIDQGICLSTECIEPSIYDTCKTLMTYEKIKAVLS